MKRGNRINAACRRVFARAFVVAPVVFLLVAGAGCPSLFESSTQRVAHSKQAVVGKDGAYAVPAANTVVNVYAPLAGTADPVAGDTTITVTDATFLAAVAEGDLLLIVQMAGATIDTYRIRNLRSGYGSRQRGSLRVRRRREQDGQPNHAWPAGFAIATAALARPRSFAFPSTRP